MFLIGCRKAAPFALAFSLQLEVITECKLHLQSLTSWKCQVLKLWMFMIFEMILITFIIIIILTKAHIIKQKLLFEKAPKMR